MRVAGRASDPPLSPSVLVVDDSPDTADSTAEFLALCGYAARVAYGGEEALRAVDEDPPDVVLLDLGMPAMSGWELARRLGNRQSGSRPVLIAVSGYGDAAARRRSAGAGIDLHLVKPVDTVILLGVMRRYSGVPAPA